MNWTNILSLYYWRDRSKLLRSSGVMACHSQPLTRETCRPPSQHHDNTAVLTAAITISINKEKRALKSWPATIQLLCLLLFIYFNFNYNDFETTIYFSSKVKNLLALQVTLFYFPDYFKDLYSQNNPQRQWPNKYTRQTTG